MAYLIGIDIGTSSTKTVVFNEHGKVLSLASRGYMYDIPKTGYAEQDPDIWWEASAETIAKAVRKAGIRKEEISGIGLSGQMHGMVPLDANGSLVRKAILHCDVRAVDITEDLSVRIGRQTFYDITYNPLFSGMQLVSLEWMRKNEPECFEKTKWVICPKDYVRYKLTGEIGTEATDASGTLAYDMQNQSWAGSLIERLGLSSVLFPQIKLSCDIAGTVTKEAAEKTGLKEGTLVVYGGGDQAMHSLGNGVLEKNILMATIGTSGQVIMLSNKLIKNQQMNTHTFCHVNPNMWFGLGACLYAGAALNWFRRTFAEEDNYERLSALAETVAPCSEGLVFFPAMSGERTPYLDMETRGAFLGMTIAHTKAHFARAIMEGVAMEMKQSIEIMKELYGQPAKYICAGGGANSSVWAQIQADVYGCEIHISDIPEQACLGAAITAGTGTGVFGNIKEGFYQMSHNQERIIEPQKENMVKYAEYYEDIFKRIYNCNAELFHKMKKY